MAETPPTRLNRLSRRERQIMEVLYRLEAGTVSDVRQRLPEPPTNSAVRAALRLLEKKGHVGHRQDGPRNVYFPTVPRERASRGALRHMVETFFGGSPGRALAALIELDAAAALTDEEIDRLESLLEERRADRTGEDAP